MTDSQRFTLRHLPLPAKLVVSVFLMAVGVGYFSALVQLHFQHSDKDGTPMPTAANVVAVFAGKKWPDPGDAAPVSRLEILVSGKKDGGFSSSNMAPAFFSKCEIYHKEIRDGRPKADVDDEREGERRAVVAWSKLDPDARKTAYDRDAFELPAELVGKPVPKVHATDAKTVKVKSILTARCGACHAPGKEKGDILLDSYESLAKLMVAGVAPPAGDGWVDSGKQIGLVKLTQSTHAHLLSFSMLFSLTGLVFAFSSYPVVVRCVLGPLVLIAQVADVSCWWLARLPDVGPYFAYCILGTGGLVGMGLAAQIVLSLFNMYDRGGKRIVLLVFLLGGAAGGLVMLKVVKPFLDTEKQDAAAKLVVAEKPAEKPPVAAGTGVWGKKILTGPVVLKTGPWDAKVEGGMVRAFFDKEQTFKDAAKAKGPELPKLTKERETEQALLAEWFGLPDDARKKAYDTDSWAIPNELAAQPLTTEFKAGAAVKVKSLLVTRCVVCHGDGGDKADAPMETYDQLRKYFGPPPTKGEKIPMAGD